MAYCNNEFHQFMAKNENLVLNVRSGVFFSLDQMGLDVMKLISDLKSFSIEQVIDTLNQYDKQEIITILKTVFEYGLVYENILGDEFSNPTRGMIVPTRSTITNLCLNMSQECNLACRYCYGDEGTYGGGSLRMDTEIAEKCVEFIMKYSGNNKRVNLIFFGGEPLLNFDTIIHTIDYAKIMESQSNKKVRFSMTTNGTLLTEDKLRYLMEKDVGIQISIDGPKSFHDSIRPLKGDGSSYDQIIPNIKRLIENRPGKVTARATITREFLDLEQIITHLFSIGFGNVHVAPCTGNEGPLYLTTKDYRKLTKQYEDYTDIFIDKFKNNEFHSFSNLIKYVRLTMSSKSPKLYACGAFRSYLGASSDGELYPCHRFVGHDEFHLGNVDGGLKSEMQKKFLRNAWIENMPKCKKCWARYLCGGSCYHDSLVATGDIYKPNPDYCKFQKRIIELAMYINHKFTVDREKTLEEMIKIYEEGTHDFEK